MTDKQYAADCIEFLRELAQNIRESGGVIALREGDADKLEEIATSLQVDTQEEDRCQN
jgi:hypothetical protein